MWIFGIILLIIIFTGITYASIKEWCQLKQEHMKENNLVDQYYSLRGDLEDAVYKKVSNYTKDNPLECNISLDFGTMGISTLEMSNISFLYIDEGPSEEREVHYTMDDNDPRNGDYGTPLQWLPMDDLITVYKDLYGLY